jgi:glycerol uptake facilitator-like aquaporin
MAVFRGLPWRKAAAYIFGQLIGAWLGALIVFANYSRAINIYEGGNGQRTLKSAALFSTYPVSSCFSCPPPVSPYLTVVDSSGLARLRVVSQLLFR